MVGETLVVEDGRHWIEGRKRMRLVTFATGSRTGVGVRRDGAVFDTGYADMFALISDGSAGLERAGAADDEVRDAQLLAPIRPGKILCSGVNYASHAEENPNAVMPEEPFFFSKLPSAVIGPGEPIRIPRQSTLTDYEVELAMVIGARGYRIPEQRALEHVFGWTILHDVSARDVQFKDSQITLGKNPDTFRADRAGDRDERRARRLVDASRLVDAERAGDAELGHCRDAVPAGSATRVPF
jgi:2-keto-4-pentenoate hydratase/2-oxohepta-3-ene-1,7-dioic acid hydratase in catechol pathway